MIAVTDFLSLLMEHLLVSPSNTLSIEIYFPCKFYF